MVADFLVGAWARSGLIVDGLRRDERCRVLWLQTPDWYADIRIPLETRPWLVTGAEALFARPWAFAGTAAWNPPVMTWHHQLDSSLEDRPDSNPLECRGDVLVERGTVEWNGRRVRFAEEWRRLGPPGVATSATVGAKRVEVTAGDWRISVEDERPAGSFCARVWELEGDTWTMVGSVVEPAASFGSDRPVYGREHP